MKSFGWIRYVLAALLLPLLVGGVRMTRALSRQPPPLVAASSVPRPAPKAHDPGKPTVAVLLGADVTEITDALGPYEIFARAGRFNVYAVAPTDASTALTGGLRIRPHYSFDELDELLGGAAPQVVVAPNLPNVQAPENRAAVEWVRRTAEAGAISFSWCAGAAVLAEAGLLDGRTATSHWGDLARLERQYPRVNWVRGVRWVDHGHIVTSAGITSGIDATLRVLTRLEGEHVARRIAADLSYPNFKFALDPRAEQYTPRLPDAVLFLNAAFKPLRQRLGVVLYEGVGELDVSAFYDAHAAASVAEVHAVARTARPVITAHGLWLEPELVTESDAKVIAGLDRLLVPGRDAHLEAGAFIDELSTVSAKAPEYLQAEGAKRFSLEPVLEDLSRSADQASATFAQRRLEYRSNSLTLQGRALPFMSLLLPVLLGIGGILLARTPRLVGSQRQKIRTPTYHRWDAHQGSAHMRIRS
jgi:AraC family transcriptional regulator, transcriptional activator FtrA